MEDEEAELRTLAWRLVDKLLPARGAHANQRQLRDHSDSCTQRQRGGEEQENCCNRDATGGGGRLRGGGAGGGEVTFRAHDSFIGGGLGLTGEGGRIDEGAEVQSSARGLRREGEECESRVRVKSWSMVRE